MTLKQIEEFLGDRYPEDSVLLANGFEEAFIGVGEQFNDCAAVYDRDACIRILMDRDGMTNEEAEEYFCFNVSGSYVGEQTPIFLTKVPE
jgi:hypothetical protein